MIFLRQAKIPGHLEDHIMAKTNGSRNFSDLLDAIQILARRPMSQISSSFPSYYDEWDESTNATEYYDIDNRDDVDNDEYYDEYNEPEDHDNEWIDMSDIREDATFEEPELAWETSSWSSERYRRVHQRSQRTDAVKSFVLRDKEREPVDQLSVQGQRHCHVFWH